MNDLSRDARALVARVRRRDGPSAEDRARLRNQLEAAWAVSHPEATAGALADAVAAAPASTRSLQPAAAVLIVSLGFLAPEAPRELHLAERQAPQPGAAQSLGWKAASPTAAPPADDAARLQPRAANELPPPPPPPPVPKPSASVPFADGPAVARAPSGSRRAVDNRTVERRLSRRSQPQITQPSTSEASATSARTRDSSPASSSSAPARNSAPASHFDPTGRTDAHDSAGRARPLDARDRRRERPALERSDQGGDVGPTVRDRSFAPQPIDDELAWLGAAQDALRDGQPSRALSLVQQHAFRFPRGALAPERSAVQALALCALGRKESARSVLANLARRSPSSPLVDRVRRSCGLR